MNNFCVKDLMVPISEYATVEVGTTMLEALRVLRRAQSAYTESRYLHRGILVLDKEGTIIGKLSQLRVLRAVIPDVTSESNIDMQQFGFSKTFINSMKIKYRISNKIINRDNLKKRAFLKVEEFMQTLEPGEYVAENASLDEAVYRLVSRTHLSLLVTGTEGIVGVLRIADVFAALSREMEEIVQEMENTVA